MTIYRILIRLLGLFILFCTMVILPWHFSYAKEEFSDMVLVINKLVISASIEPKALALIFSLPLLKQYSQPYVILYVAWIASVSCCGMGIFLLKNIFRKILVGLIIFHLSILIGYELVQFSRLGIAALQGNKPFPWGLWGLPYLKVLFFDWFFPAVYLLIFMNKNIRGQFK